MSKNNQESENEVKNTLRPYDYGCEILLEDTTEEESNNPNFPNDAYNVYYRQSDKDCLDVCRGGRVKIFDYYYDKYGKNSIQKIVWGYGKMNPKVWLTNRTSKKRKK